jgi:hypothetical protein
VFFWQSVRYRHRANIEENPHVNYSSHVIEVRQAEVFSNWLRKLRDEKARARIQIRIRRLSLGSFGDAFDPARLS